jgi:precorrin-2/cobalt-factor-2 C20-methyltransferase
VNAGRCYGVGVGPGDPELITVKGLRLVQGSPVIAYFSKARRPSNARRVVADWIRPGQDELPFTYPVTTEALPDGVDYDELLGTCYDESAAAVARRLDTGDDVVVLCEGDPLFYGSFMYLHSRLSPRYEVEVVPGVTSMVAGAAALGTPLVARDERFTVLSGLMAPAEIEAGLRSADAAVILKLGRHFPDVRAAVERAGLLDRAHYVERASTSAQRILPLADVDPATVPYFSLLVIPSATAPTR